MNRKHLILLSALLTAACSAQPPVLFLSRPGNGNTGSEEETLAYYQRIGADPDLKTWMANRCFNTPGVEVLEAFYYNGSDLGLGREIFCAECPPGSAKPGLISCGVSNHGVPQGLDGFTFPFADNSGTKLGVGRKESIKGALTGLEQFRKSKAAGKFEIRGASVVFDFDKNRSEAEGKVRMYIYDANTPLLFSSVNRGKQPEVLIPGLQLDGEGEALNAKIKFMRNCLTCHGGKWDAKSNAIVGASFLDFDAFLFNYSNDIDPEIAVDPVKFPNPLARCDKTVEQFRKLSELILKVVDPAQGGTGAVMIQDRVKQNLANNFFLKFNEKGQCTPETENTYVTEKWNNNKTVARIGNMNISAKEFFKTVVHKYCGSCHFSQTAGNNLRLKDPSKPLTFEDPDQWFNNTNLIDLSPELPTSVDLIKARVCGSSDMPHAEVTRNNMKRDAKAFAYVCNSTPVP